MTNKVAVVGYLKEISYGMLDGEETLEAVIEISQPTEAFDKRAEWHVSFLNDVDFREDYLSYAMSELIEIKVIGHLNDNNVIIADSFSKSDGALIVTDEEKLIKVFKEIGMPFELEEDGCIMLKLWEHKMPIEFKDGKLNLGVL